MKDVLKLSLKTSTVTAINEKIKIPSQLQKHTWNNP